MIISNDERGAAAVEFALVLPLLVLLLFGIVEFGIAFRVQTTLSGAAREGVRVMALQNDPAAARAQVRATATGLSVTDSEISVTPSSCSGGTATATVTVRYPHPFVSGLFGASVTLTGKGVMRCNG